MSFVAVRLTRFGAWTFVGCLLVAGCSSSSDDGGGGGGSSGLTTFSCGQAGKACFEYYGSASNIGTIRDATKCVEQGGVEGTGCAAEGAIKCTLPTNGGTGTGGAQYYYGVSSEDDVAALKTTCDRVGGTFSAPPP
jgi:hypothetical protein